MLEFSIIPRKPHPTADFIQIAFTQVYGNITKKTFLIDNIIQHAKKNKIELL